jgi:diguanylate cyclase (GGDEF)-like protein
MASPTLPSLFATGLPAFAMGFKEAIWGPVALAALLGSYAVYQQMLMKRLRQQLAERQGHSLWLRNLAMVDPLTGLFNRRFAEQRLAAEVARSERKGHSLSILLMDLDGFKKVNDTYGHPAGDRLLQVFAEGLRKAIRVTDLAARMGGDEFLVLLPDCRAGEVQHVLDRLRSLSLNWNAREIPISFSAGWEEYKAGERLVDLMIRTDHALYEAKRTGKNSRFPEPITRHARNI